MGRGAEKQETGLPTRMGEAGLGSKAQRGRYEELQEVPPPRHLAGAGPRGGLTHCKDPLGPDCLPLWVILRSQQGQARPGAEDCWLRLGG